MSYFAVHVTTAALARTAIDGLPPTLELRIAPDTGWQLWRIPAAPKPPWCLAEEWADDPWRGLVVDVGGLVLCDSLNRLPPRKAR